MAQTTATKPTTTKATEKNVSSVKLVRAYARFIQMSPQKLRLVADVVRNTPVDLALEQLRFSSKKAALPLSKCINSAVANAQHNFNMRKEDLFIKTLTIDAGPVLKRFKPRAQGRAGAIHKRSSHISVILEERKQSKSKSSRSVFNAFRPTKSAKVEEHSHDHDAELEEGKTDKSQNTPKPTPRSEEKQKQNKISLKRRLFNRKSGE
jgi:large subunit ribosomal protein L22